jgi:hypothetical protein
MNNLETRSWDSIIDVVGDREVAYTIVQKGDNGVEYEFLESG